MKRLVNTRIDKRLNQWLFDDYVSKWMNAELLFQPESSSRFRACLFIGKIYVSASSHSLTRINRTTNPVGGYSGSSLNQWACHHTMASSFPWGNYGKSHGQQSSGKPGHVLIQINQSHRGVSDWLQPFCSSSLKHFIWWLLSQKHPPLCSIGKPIKVYTDLTIPK